MLSPDFDDLRLLHLAEVYERREILGLTVLPQHVRQNAFIPTLVFLVCLHNGGTDVEVRRLVGKGANGTHLWKRLKPELTHEAWKLEGIVGSRRLLVPHRPVVHVSVVRVVRNFLEISAGRAGPVRHRIGILVNRALEDIGEENYIILPNAVTGFRGDRLFEVLALAPMVPASFHFVVPAPDDDTRMVSQALNLLDSLLPNIFLEPRIPRDHVSAEHEFLPDHDPEFVTNIEEVVGLVITAAPFTYHIHVRVTRGFENVAMHVRGHTIGKAVEWNNVRTLGEHGNTIHYELETLSPLIRNTA